MGRSSKKTLAPADVKEDLILLPTPSDEAAILANIKDRYSRNQIFTRIGAGALVVVNPVKTLESFSDHTSAQYADWAKDTSEDKQPLPAHIFDLAASVFYHMSREQQDQSVVFCGESGSGKTEARKLFVRQLIALSKNAKKKSKVHSGVIKTETVLDAFGTARTLLNPSSSRFGRYTEYQYDSHGRLVGAKMLDYLLEKDRVSSTPADERNFHIFYYLLAGATTEEKTQWRLHDATQFTYLQTPRPARLTTEDQIKLGELRDHLKSLGVGRRLQAQIYQLMAAILHLGNITFQEDPERPKESCTVKNQESLEIAAELLGVAARNLESALTVRTKLVWRDVVSVFMNTEDASAQRDSLAKALYSLVFGWLVEHINARLCKDECATFVGVVDLAGFQDMRYNDIEQLLGNYASERLQQFVTKRILDSHEEYVREGIRSVSVSQNTNAAVVDLLSSALSVVDSASVDQQNSRQAEKSLMTRLTEKLGSNELFAEGTTASSFGIRHFSRTVDYDTSLFLEKNKDTLCPDFVSIFRGNGKDIPSSANGFVRGLFSEKTVSTESGGRDGGMVTRANTLRKPLRQPSLKRAGGRYGGHDSSNPETVGYNFRSAIDEMIETLSETIPWVVLCIKPNEDLSGDRFESKRVKGQLRGFGMTQIAQARAAADYTANYSIDEFLARYRVIIDPMKLDESGGPSGKCEDFVLQSNWTNREMAVGRTKVFLSESSWRSLEDELRTIEEQLKADRKARGRSQSRDSRDRRSGSPTSALYDDATSHYSSEYEYADETGSFFDDTESNYQSEFEYNSLSHQTSQITLVPTKMDRDRKGDVEAAHNSRTTDTLVEEEDTSTSARRQWVCCTWMLTWWIPPFCLSMCGGMKRKDIQMAWREKVALCIIIFLCCCALAFFIVGLGLLLCPRANVLSISEIASKPKSTTGESWAYAYGRAFMIKDIVTQHTAMNVPNYVMGTFFGTDVSELFDRTNMFSTLCPGIPAPPASWTNLAAGRIVVTSGNTNLYLHNSLSSTTQVPQNYLGFMNQYARSRVAWPWSEIEKQGSTTKRWVVIHDNLYDLSAYTSVDGGLFNDPNMDTIIGFYGKDATSEWNKLIAGPNPALAKTYLTCMNNMFYQGIIDHRDDFRCQFSNYVLLASTILLITIIGFKFLAALQFGAHRDPEDHDKFVICQVPCYTEGADSLTKTLESLAVLRYDDKRKLLFVICDGNIIGSGNDRPTPRIVLDILGVDPSHDPEPLVFQSLGDGDKQLNMAKVYSGLYEVEGHSVPYIVVVKVGKPSERSRPGNRGKRDSQMILMRFLSRVHFNSEMNPMELELYHHMKNIIGVNPSFYEYTLMVDADTEVYPDSLNRMVSAMIHDSKIMGLCGETLLANEKESLTTMIQVYEYFISHHLAKAFESLFGSVTCLPGCFCMYRVRTPTKNVPLLISPSVIEDYSENRVTTLHMKNLLHLGEDRYLTTLMMKHFPNLKLSFTNDAQCRTNAPDQWSVLLSQRRRWINSTVHNLFELVHLPQLCGFCCFSMRFIVMLDLISTLVQPVVLLYIGYLVYSIVANSGLFPLMSIIMLAAIYGLQVIIFILKREWAQIGWMIVWILAMPMFSFFLPLYSFWHFDDFSWGNTRVVTGENGKKMIYASDAQPFDPSSIPLKKWSDHEAETWEDTKGGTGSEASKDSEFGDGRRTPGNGSTYSGPTPQYGPPSTFGGSAYGGGGGSVYSGYAGAPPPGSVYAPSAYGGGGGAPPPQLHMRHSMLSAGSGYAAGGGGAGPSDDDLLRETRRILATANLMTVTKKQVRDELGAVFGTDLNPRKGTINGFIEDILQGRL